MSKTHDWTADFPILAADENGSRLVYLDSAATTQHPRQVLDAVVSYYNKDNANPHRGVYELAMRATDAHEGARRRVAQFFHAEEEEIVFTQNTTEALNLAAYSYGLHFLHAGDEIVLSVAEHHSNLVPWQRVAAATGAKLVYLYPGPDGHLTTEELDRKITARTRLVAVAMVSNVLGLRAPVEEIVARAHAVGAVVVLDCAQSAPHMPVDVKALDVDFAACSAHKLYAPMGVGALYARAGLLDAMPPFLSGGDMIAAVHEQTASWADGPRRFEAGTRNVGGEVGFAAALDYIEGIGWQAITEHEHALLDRMLRGMAAMPWLTVYGEPAADRRYGVVSFNVDEVHPHDVATILDAGGVAVRAGHHCAQPLMEYLGIGACCRASVAVYNTPADIDALLENLENVRKVMGL